jgi:hypothetical protein
LDEIIESGFLYELPEFMNYCGFGDWEGRDNSPALVQG